MTKFLHEGYKDICIHLELPFSFDMQLYTNELPFQINSLLLLDVNLVSRWPGYRQQQSAWQSRCLNQLPYFLFSFLLQGVIREMKRHICNEGPTGRTYSQQQAYYWFKNLQACAAGATHDIPPDPSRSPYTSTTTRWRPQTGSWCPRKCQDHETPSEELGIILLLPDNVLGRMCKTAWLTRSEVLLNNLQILGRQHQDLKYDLSLEK